MVWIILPVLLMTPTDPATPAQEEHEYSSIRSSEQDAVRDLLNFPVRSPGGEVTGILDPFERSGYPPVLLISFVAEWCEHCNYEAPFLSELEENWSGRGLGMVAVFEYTNPETAEGFMKRYHLSMPYYLGQIPGKFKDLRETTTHYQLRTLLADERGWGTPFHLILIGGDKEKIYFAAGEFVREELIQRLEEWLPPQKR
ncbi:MAG: TlpA family protein disulfide reductase [Fidelibacterota bacterium]